MILDQSSETPDLSALLVEIAVVVGSRQYVVLLAAVPASVIANLTKLGPRLDSIQVVDLVVANFAVGLDSPRDPAERREVAVVVILLEVVAAEIVVVVVVAATLTIADAPVKSRPLVLAIEPNTRRVFEVMLTVHIVPVVLAIERQIMGPESVIVVELIVEFVAVKVAAFVVVEDVVIVGALYEFVLGPQERPVPAFVAEARLPQSRLVFPFAVAPLVMDLLVPKAALLGPWIPGNHPSHLMHHWTRFR